MPIALRGRATTRRTVTVGVRGKNALFVRRGPLADEGFVRIDGKTVTGFVPDFERGGRVFYAYGHGKNAKLAA